MSESSDKPIPRIDRRKAIIGVAGFITGIAATAGVTRLLEQPSLVQRIITRSRTIEPASSLDSNKLYLFVSENYLFGNCSQDELAQAMALVAEQIQHYSTKAEFKGRKQATLNHKGTMILAGEILENRAAAFILALIFVESSGNPISRTDKDPFLSAQDKSDPDRAQGLCQIKPSTAKQMLLRLTAAQKEKLGIIGSSIDLSKPLVNIALALEYKKWLYEIFDNDALSVWAYHLGVGNLKDLINIYLSTKGLVDPEVIKDDLSDNRWVQNIKKYVHDPYQLNSVKLINFIKETQRNGSPALNKYLKNIGVEGDDTQHYITRITAADYLLNPQTKA